MLSWRGTGGGEMSKVIPEHLSSTPPCFLPFSLSLSSIGLQLGKLGFWFLAYSLIFGIPSHLGSGLGFLITYPRFICLSVYLYLSSGEAQRRYVVWYLHELFYLAFCSRILAVQVVRVGWDEMECGSGIGMKYNVL